MPSEYDGVSPRINLGEQSPYADVSRHHFGSQPEMPWHEVDCPKCDGMGYFESQRSADPQDTEAKDCDLCSGLGEVKTHIARAYLEEGGEGGIRSE